MTPFHRRRNRSQLCFLGISGKEPLWDWPAGRGGCLLTVLEVLGSSNNTIQKESSPLRLLGLVSLQQLMLAMSTNITNSLFLVHMDPNASAPEDDSLILHSSKAGRGAHSRTALETGQEVMKLELQLCPGAASCPLTALVL